MAEEYKRMRQMVGTATDWATDDLIIGDGEIAFERDGSVIKAKLGDGGSTYSQLTYFTESLWESSGSYTFNRIDGPVIVGGTSGPDRLTVRGGNYALGAYREEIATDGQELGKVKLGALEGTASLSNGVQIHAEAQGDWSPTNHGARLRFRTTPENATTPVNVVVIADDGGMVIGAPTGGSMGAGTLNVEALYIDGVIVP